MLRTGQTAPSFSLPDQDGKTVDLAALKGRWVVLYFYPKDDTPGCTVEACEFTAGLKGFEGLDAVVLGCSADSAESHRKFIAKYKLKITLLTDADRKVMQAYGAWGEKVLYGKKTVGVIRSTVLIDPQGRVARHWAKVRAAGHAEAVAQALAELRGGGAAKARKSAKPAKAAKPKAAAARRKATKAPSAARKKARAPRKPVAGKGRASKRAPKR